MTATTTDRGRFNPRRPLTWDERRRLAASARLQDSAKVAADGAYMLAYDDAMTGRQPRTPARKASSRWTDGLALLAGLAVVALLYVVGKAWL